MCRDLEKLLQLITTDSNIKGDEILCVFWSQELYHELHVLDRFEQEYQRRHLEESSVASQRGHCQLFFLSLFFVQNAAVHFMQRHTY